MNVSFSFPLMCSRRGLLPQSSPSHLIHKEMTGITIPTKDALGQPVHYIILYLCSLAPTALHGAEKLYIRIHIILTGFCGRSQITALSENESEGLGSRFAATSYLLWDLDKLV